MHVMKQSLPEFQDTDKYPPVTKKEVENRYEKIIQRIKEMNLTHIIIYGDREHCANLKYLTGGYDSRFEESLLIIRERAKPLLVTGNEGYSYSDICLLEHEKELYQTFSLQGQTRDKKRYLRDILKEHDFNSKAKIGIIGFKYYEEGEFKDPERTFDIPHFILEEIAGLTPRNQIFNVTHIMSHPENGLRSMLDHHEIARFEVMNNYLSNQMRKVIRNLKIGISEAETLKGFVYKGIPFSVHPVVNFGKERVLLGLASPTFDTRLKLGDIVSIAFGVDGANIARTGFAVFSNDDFSGKKSDIVETFYFPYFEAIKTWYETIGIGTQSKSVYERVMGIIGHKRFGVTLNPGHQIHYEEWINSPFRSDISYVLKSGMVFQCDIIAFPGEPYIGVHVEDTVVLADANLRDQLKKEYPEVWERINVRQNMLRKILGMNVREDVLPLSNLQAVLYPFLLDSDYIITDV